MNREIIFRSWYHNTMYYDVMVGYCNEEKRTFVYKQVGYFEIISDLELEGAEIMQYAGLKDIKEKKIYEGDICKVDETYIGDCLEKGFIGNVLFEDGCFQINKPNTKYGGCDLDISTILNREIEVIGNIFENPELIK